MNRIEATPAVKEALTGFLSRERQKSEFIAQESEKMRRTRQRKEDEQSRIKSARSAKDEEGRRRIAVTVMEDGGHKRTVKRLVTTADKLVHNKLMPRKVKNALDEFAMLVADGLGAATRDGDDSTSRLTCTYEPMSGSGYGSRTPSDRMIDGLTAYRIMKAKIPEQLMATFDQIIGEETGNLNVRRRTLAEIGEEAGYTHKQASSAGGMQVTCVAMMIAHYMEDRKQAIPL